MENIIRLENISYSYYDRIPALFDISLKINEGESFAIIGANGSGKSTLLRVMNGLIYPSSGRFFFKENEISEKSLKDKGMLRFFRERVGYVFQDPDTQLFCPTVFDELLYGPLQLEIEEKEAANRAFEVMEMLEIEDLKDRSSYMLSEGEKKRVAIGSVLTINPDVLLLDEPTSGLDPRSQVELIDIIQRLKESGKTIITATHDLALIEDISDRTLVLGEDHSILKEGMPHEVLKDRDTLLSANLIHKHPHRHAWFVHDHSHYAEHDHEHLSESVDNMAIKRDIAEMTDIDKLKKLLEHWIEHNKSHREDYQKWAKRMEIIIKEDQANIFKEIAEETERIEKLFLRLKEIL